MANKKEKAKKKPEKQEEKQTVEQEPELKIIREIKPELREIEQEQDEQEQETEEDFQESFFSDNKGAESPILKRTDLEQTVDEVELPEDRRRKEKEEEKEGVLKYTPDMGEKYFSEEPWKEEEEKKDKGEPRLLRIERAPESERVGHFERQLRAREKPVKFIEDWQEQEPWKEEGVLKYEKAEPETHGAELPFSPKEIERRTKKYKKKL